MPQKTHKKNDGHFFVFGPVPSRRLGSSLGVNNVPAKSCTYSCPYCQIGITKKKAIKRKEFFKPEIVTKEVIRKLNQIQHEGRKVDYITFVPTGEPTLDIKLGEEIDLLLDVNIPIAVISNSSLIWDEKVREDLYATDLVSLKVDSVREDTWKKINRPHSSLVLNEIMDGVEDFACSFKGSLITETMIIPGLNDKFEEIYEIGSFISDIPIEKAYISIPTRPPAEKWVEKPIEKSIMNIYHILMDFTDNVELLVGDKGSSLSIDGNIENEVLAMTSVHPIRKESILDLITNEGGDRRTLQSMVERELIKEVTYGDESFFIRNIIHE